MTARILTGQEPANAILESIKDDVKTLDPKLVIVQVGSDPASNSYIRKKLDSAKKIGMRHEHLLLRDNITQAEMYAHIKTLNEDDDVTGYIIQLPLPDHLAKIQPQLFREIDRYKDVDGFTAYNLGKVFLSPEFEHLPPATPAGVVAMLEHYDIDVEGKNVVVIGASNIVGKPLAVMLLNRGATVTVCHAKTKKLTDYTAHADIIVTAVGKPGLITEDMVKEGVVIIDIGMSQTAEGLKGDADFETLQSKASAITPVPGGVGPMTVASLLKNCVTAKKRQMERASLSV
jgi:methylenetetrahydrofolate dehydrogenase (NADP+) / methenyltetrahydrofolate cyclohydrolase